MRAKKYVARTARTNPKLPSATQTFSSPVICAVGSDCREEKVWACGIGPRSSEANTNIVYQAPKQKAATHLRGRDVSCTRQHPPASSRRASRQDSPQNARRGKQLSTPGRAARPGPRACRPRTPGSSTSSARLRGARVPDPPRRRCLVARREIYGASARLASAAILGASRGQSSRPVLGQPDAGSRQAAPWLRQHRPDAGSRQAAPWLRQHRP